MIYWIKWQTREDKLAVGTVSNMYTIVEKLNNADKIIKQ